MTTFVRKVGLAPAFLILSCQFEFEGKNSNISTLSVGNDLNAAGVLRHKSRLVPKEK